MSTENKSLKFIHLASTASAAHSSDNLGAIIFEPKSGRIAVDGAKGLEYYGGGRVSDAKFENSILTISFNNGDKDIVLDFTDTASASGVDKILGKLRYDVDALETTVNGDGTDGSGLVAKVTKNTTDIAKNASDIADINNESTGILTKAKTYTDGKITELRGGADGYAGSLKDLDGRITSNGTDITNLRALHADGTGETAVDGKMKVIDEINAKVGAIDTDTVKDYVDGKVTGINATTAGLRTDVDNLKTTVGSSTSGLVKKVADLEGLHAAGDHNGKATVAEEVAAGIAKVVANAPADFDTLKEIADWIANDKTGAAAMSNRIGTLEGKVGASTDAANADGSVYARIKKNVADISGLTARHNGDLTVAEEVTEGIAAIGPVTKTNDEGSPKTADVVVTVTTAAGSVSGVTVDAGVLAGKVTTNTNDIKNLKTTVGSSTSGLVKDVADNKVAITNNASAIAKNTGLINANTGKITALEGLHAGKSGGGKMTVADEADARIAVIAEKSASNTTGADVVVTVTTEAGSVKTVAVNADVLAGKVTANTNAITAEVTRAMKAEGDLRDDLGTKTDVSTKDTAFGRIAALEKNQADGALMWFDWQD